MVEFFEVHVFGLVATQGMVRTQLQFQLKLGTKSISFPVGQRLCSLGVIFKKKLTFKNSKISA